MEVFQSLNCVVCKLPLARKANEARSPRHLNCGSAMCHECFEKERRLEKEEREHRCVWKHCFKNSNFAFYLIDLLSQEDSLKLSPFGDGYLLVKIRIKLTERKKKKNYCNHLVCTKCYLKNRTPNTDTETKEYPHEFTCPICNEDTVSNYDANGDRFQDFLNELPMMTRQMEGVRNPRVCGDCKKTRGIDEMHHCDECHSTICPRCAFEGHRFHETTPLFKKELWKMSEAQQKDTVNVMKECNDSFARMHKNILEARKAFGTKLTLKEENCKSISTFEEAKQKLEKCAKLRKDFKMISEKLMPDLGRYEKKVKELTEAIDKDDYQGFKKWKEECLLS